MVFRWRANDDPHSHHQLKKVVKVGPLSGSAHAAEQLCFMCEVRFYAPITQLLKQHVA